MRVPKRELTDGIRAEIDRAMIRMNASTGAEDPETRRIYREAGRSVWVARRGTIATWLAAFPLATLGAMVGLHAGFGLSPVWALVPALAAIVPIHRRLPATCGLTADELRAFRPMLALTTPEAAYLDALIASTAPEVAPALRGEVLPAMRRLVEETARLDRLETSLGGSDEETVRSELDAMRARLDSVADPAAREALAHAVATAERRLVALLSEDAARERIASYRAMIDQSARAARETVRRIGSGAGGATLAGLDLAALRASAEGAGREVAALEAAVQEMRAA